MRTHNIPSCKRTHFHGSKGVRVSEVTQMCHTVSAFILRIDKKVVGIHILSMGTRNYLVNIYFEPLHLRLSYCLLK